MKDPVLSMIKQESFEEQERRFARLKPLLEAISDEAVKPISLDLSRVSVAGMNLLQKARRPDIKAHLDTLPEALFSKEWIQQLEDLSIVVWHIKVRNVVEGAAFSLRAIPDEVRQEGLAIRTRMVSLVDYHLRTSAQNIAVIEKIKEGTGHIDLAMDLQMLAELVTTHQAELETDTKNYRAEDISRAAELVTIIRTALAEDPERFWAQWAGRAFVLLRDIYERVRRAAEFVSKDLKNAPDFPRLFAAARKPPRRRKKAEGLKSKAKNKAPKAKDKNAEAKDRAPKDKSPPKLKKKRKKDKAKNPSPTSKSGQKTPPSSTETASHAPKPSGSSVA